MGTIFLLLSTLFALSHQTPIEQEAFLNNPRQQYNLALEAILGTGLRMQTFLADETDENFLCSPISATVILSQLILGTRGEFQDKLVELIHLPNPGAYLNDKVINHNSNTSESLPYARFHFEMLHLLKDLEMQNSSLARTFVLKEKSAIFHRDGIKLSEDYVRRLSYFYGTDFESLDFVNRPDTAQMHINNWAFKNTNGKIRQILSEPPSPNTAAIFANAIYFFANWEMPFDSILNRVGPFNVSATKTVNVTYMIGSQDNILYGESENYKMVMLPYTNEELGMYIMLPNEDHPNALNIKNFVPSIKASDVLNSFATLKRRDVIVKLPKMALTHTFSIMKNLRKYLVYKKVQTAPVNHPARAAVSAIPRISVRGGDKVDELEKDIFTFNNFTDNHLNRAERPIFLNNATPDGKLILSDIIQHVSVTVNEKGTEAAAISSSTIDYIGGQKNMRCDRPFVFFIRHIATGATLFWGTISNPIG